MILKRCATAKILILVQRFAKLFVHLHLTALPTARPHTIQPMGLFATVRASVDCPTCGSPRRHAWQFYFGAVSGLPMYKVGDAIRWDGAQCIGNRESFVRAIGYCDGETFCAPCRQEHALANVEVRGGRIVDVTFRSFEAHTADAYFELDAEGTLVEPSC